MPRKRSVDTGQPLEAGGPRQFCPTCGRRTADCSCHRHKPSEASAPSVPRDGIVRVGRRTKGRKGKGVTVVTGVPLAGPELVRLARELKQGCGSGGTVREGVIEIQGDHRQTLARELAGRGWTVKLVGG